MVDVSRRQEWEMKDAPRGTEVLRRLAPQYIMLDWEQQLRLVFSLLALLLECDLLSLSVRVKVFWPVSVCLSLCVKCRTSLLLPGDAKNLASSF